jgi:hypothetical protein
MKEARELQARARLEDLSVRQVDYKKETKTGKQNYPRWYASWREDNKVRHVYLGSYKKMSKAEALEKARRLKAMALGDPMIFSPEHIAMILSWHQDSNPPCKLQV